MTASSRTPRRRPAKAAPDHPTPKTDALIKSMKRGRGVPVCDEWTKLEEHAREMERMWFVSRLLAVTYLRALGGGTKK